MGACRGGEKMRRNGKYGLNCKNCMDTVQMVESGEYGKECKKCKDLPEMVEIAKISSFYQFFQKFPKMVGNWRGDCPINETKIPHMYMELVLTIS